MKIAIFGTGRIYYRYWPYLEKEQVVCLVDNDEAKIGKFINGVEVILPAQLMKREFDMVLLLSVHYREMRRQLIDLGIPEEVIYNYFEMGNGLKKSVVIHSRGKKCTFDEWTGRRRGEKSVMLISHELSYTGAPIALLNMAKIMRKMGVDVLYVGMTEGTLENELDLEGIDYINNYMFISLQKQAECIKQFDLVVVCTFSLYNLIQKYSKLDIPILWWIHEAESAYFGIEPIDCGENIKVFCGGQRARKTFQTYNKKTDARILQYCVPEEGTTFGANSTGRQKVCFSMIGMICERKAQDVFLQAVSLLPLSYQNEIEILMIGSTPAFSQKYWNQYKPLVEQMDNIKLVDGMSQTELAHAYEDIDVLVCPSRDDPMPIVVTQAMMYKKTCIISENVGQAEFIDNGINGFVFENENSEQLAEQIKWIVDHKEDLNAIGERAREIYDLNFSEKIMEQKIRNFFKEIYK